MPNDPTADCQPFPATPWSLIGRAVDAGHARHRASFEELLRRYLPALRSHLVFGKRLSVDRADDVLQSFITDKVVQSGIIARAEREKGRFRTFLLTALDRYHVSQIRMETARKRAPETMVTLEAIHDPVDAQHASGPFDVEWARQVVAEATRRTQAECEASGHPRVWELLKARLLDPAMEGTEAPDYARLVAMLGLNSPLHASNLLVTGRRMYVRNLRAVIAEYARDEAEIDDELRDLRQILAGAKT